jgi:hypothetical protein
MMKIKDSIAVIGEGITEYYYFNSLKDEFTQLNLRPMYPKHSTSLVDLEQEIDKAINKGYNQIFCVIDMDNKKDGAERQSYLNFKKRHEGTKTIKNKEFKYTIRFIETERCTELFFLFYFAYTSRLFHDQPAVLRALNKHCYYEKTEKFFKAHSLHQYFQRHDGSFMTALRNAAKSMKEKEQTGRNHTYSQMAELFETLGIIENEKATSAKDGVTSRKK